jgi:hypothetical protein
MTAFVTANFTVGATTDITALTNDDSSTWVEWYLEAGAGHPKAYTASGGVLASGSGAGFRQIYRASVIAPSADVQVTGSLHIDAAGGYNLIGIGARLNAGATAGYFFLREVSTTTWGIYKATSTTAYTLLGSSAASALTINSDLTYEFNVTGTTNVTLSLKIGGVEVIAPITDVAPGGAFVAAGYVGVFFKPTVEATGIFISSIIGNSTAVADTVAPTATGAAVANATPTFVDITMSEAMDTAFTPAASSVTVGGHTVSTLAWASSTVLRATVSAAFVNAEAARTAAYTQPGTNNARDIAGNLLANFTAQAITNNVGAVDATPPTASSAAVANATPTFVDIVMSEAMDTSFTPAASAVTVSGHIVSTLAWMSGTVLRATVSAAFVNGEVARTAAYAQPGTNNARDVAGNLLVNFSGLAITNNVAAAPGIISGTTLYNNVRFSPFNWEVTSAKAKTFHPGAYFRTIFSGPTCVLNFDMTNVGGAIPQVMYQVDGCGAWVKADISSALTISIPTNVANSSRHYLEVVIKVSGGANCWTTDNGAVILSSITLTSGNALYLPLTPATKTGLFYGDSITTGDLTVQGTANDSADAQAGWAFQIGKLLNSEFGICSFGSTKWVGVGGGSTGIPGLVDSYNLKSSGVVRVFNAPTPDYICINMGTNDGVDVTSAVTTTLNGLLSATPSTTKIIVMRPFNGAHDAEQIAGIAACSTPSRVSHLDTTGFLNTGFVDGSGLHPLAFENVSHIVPQVFPLVAAAIAGAPTLTTRTVTLTLKLDATALAASLTGLKVSFWDEASTELTTTARYQSGAQTTNASGVLTFSVNSTLASGGTGYIDIRGAGLHYNAPVVVA